MHAMQSLPLISEEEARGKKILIADDDRTAHIKFKRFLEKIGFEVLHAYDGTETYTIASQIRPDILLLDISMPQMDGRDICQRLKGDAETRKIRIIMVTGRDSVDDRLLGLKLGADEYIEKPCTPFYLERTIKAVIRSQDRQLGQVNGSEG